MEEHRIEMPELEECIICYEETVRFIKFPCNHKVCSGCFPKLRQCPLCQTDIRIQIRPEIRVEIREPRCEMCMLCFTILFITAFCLWSLKLTRTI